MATKEALKLSERSHPLYVNSIGNWEFYKDAVKGGGEMINDDYIFSHRLEDGEDFDERVSRGYYLNFCDTVPTIYNSYIFKERVERPSDENLDYFRLNTDGKGTPIADFIKKAGYYASVYGAVHALVDITSTKKNKVSKRDVRQGIISPYTTLILPSQLVDWSVDYLGNLRWVIIKTIYYRDDDPSIEREEEEHYKLITRDEWRIEDEDGEPVKFPDGEPSNGTNELGIVPFITMYHKDVDNDRIGESLIKDIVYVNRAILNWCSCMDEQIDRQTFSQLVVPDDGSMFEKSETGEDPLRKIGTGSIFTFPYDSGQPPQFIGPTTDNIIAIWDIVTDHIKEIFRLAGLVGGTGDLYASKSGRAAQMGFQGVNSALSEKASSYQKFENDISKLAYLQLGKKEEEFQLVKYPDSFDIAALNEEIDTYFKVMKGNFSVALNRTIQKNIARKSVPLASQKIRQEIENEIDAGDGIFTVDIEAKKDEGQDGNPNVNSLSDTNRTSVDLKKDEITKKKKD